MADNTAFTAAFEGTWPAARAERIGGFTYRDGAGGGSRVSATTLDGPFSEPDFAAVESRFRADARAPLFQIRGGEEAFDAHLAAQGYREFDPVTCLACELNTQDNLIPEANPKHGYVTWPTVAIQREIWAEGGIGPQRLAVMQRVTGPKTTILGRLEDAPVGACFMALHKGIAVIHALETRREARRQGVAYGMMALAADWARQQGATTLALQVTRANAGALALYSSLGMREVGQYHYRTKAVSETR